MEQAKILLLILMFQVFFITCDGQNYGDPLSPPAHTLERFNRGTVNVTAVTTSTITLDTYAIAWTKGLIDTLSSGHGIKWSTRIEERSLGSMAKTNQHLFSASDDQGMNQQDSTRYLVIEVVNEKGDAIAASRKANKEGFSIVSMIGHGDHAYLLYNENISERNRDLYVAKIDKNATFLWSTRLGKRISTHGNGLIKIHPDGRVIVMSNNYEPVHIEALDPVTGVILKNHRLDFPYEMIVKSFVINDAGNVVAIATEIYYIGSKGYTSILVFELDKNFNVNCQQYYNSHLQDWAEEIVQDDKGHYIILVNSNFRAEHFKDRYEIHILAVLDQKFQLLHQQGIRILEEGTDSRIKFYEGKIYLGDRNYREFNLHVLSPSLQLQRSYISRGDYYYPQFIEIGSGDRAWVGGYASGMWFVELELGR